MLIVPNKRAVVLRPRNPDQLLSLIPTAKEISVRGHRMVAVPHRIDETRVLANLGAKVPSPIKYHYKWSGMYSPFAAQESTAAFLTLHPRAYVLNEMGTGKTMAVLWAYDYLRSIGVLHRALVICPLSTLEPTWGDELFRHFPHLDVAVLHGSKKKRMALLEEPADVYLVNHDGLKIIGPELAKRDDIDLIVPDEIAQAARNASTDRWKALNAVVNKQQEGRRWCWGMTGTPTPNNPTDAWAQCRIVTPSTVPPYFNRFKDQVMRQVTQFLWVPRPTATSTVHSVMQPAVRYSREECIDMPDCVYQTRTVDLSVEQRKAYRDMFEKLRFEVASGKVLAVNEAIKTSKLIQICCGVAYDAHSNEVTLNADNRLKVVKEIIEEAEGKVIVFVPFISSIGKVSSYLDNAGYSTACVYGEVSKNARTDIFRNFQHTDEPRVLVAQPVAMSHGLNLTAANTIIWYAPIFSNEYYEQACARITRAGQTRAQLIVNLEGSPVEKHMYGRLRNKQRMQGLLLSMMQGSREEIDNEKVLECQP